MKPRAIHARSLAVGLAVAGIAVAHLVWLPRAIAPVFPDFDGAAYLGDARWIAAAGTTARPWSSPLEYLGVHRHPGSDGAIHSRYPPGVPVLLAAAESLGRDGALAMNPILAAFGPVLLFLLVRRRTGDAWALLAALALAVNPVANRQASHVDSHVPTAALLLAGMILLDRWSTSMRARTAFLAGLALGALPALRYAEAIVGPGALAFAIASSRARGRGWRGVAPFVAGLACLPAAVAAHNWRAFGAPWRTAYALTGEQIAFSAANLARGALPYLADLAAGLLAFLPLGLLGAASLVARRADRRFGWLLAYALVAPLLLYMAYYWRGEVGDSAPIRFLLPTFPLYIAAGVILLSRLARRAPIPAHAVAAAIVAIQLPWQAMASSHGLSRSREMAAPGLELLRWAEEAIPPGTLLIAPPSMLETLQLAGAWNLASAPMIAALGCGRGSAEGEELRETAPSPLASDRRAEIERRLGASGCPGRAYAVGAELRRWAGAAGDVLWIGDAPGPAIAADLAPEGGGERAATGRKAGAIEPAGRAPSGVALASSATVHRLHLRAAPRPSILLFVADTTRADAVSRPLAAAGRPGAPAAAGPGAPAAAGEAGASSTPTIDRVAASGTRYLRAYANAPWTLPSHASLFTGLLPQEHGVGWRRMRVPEGVATLASRLSAAGYETVGFSANLWVSRLSGLDRGFERFQVTNPKVGPRPVDPAPELEDALDAWLRERRDDRPFFLFVNVMDAHRPWTTEGARAAGAPELPPAVLQDAGLLNCATRGREPELEQLRALYDAGVAAADRRLAFVLERLRDAGLDTSLGIVVTSDHGEQFGERGLVDHQFSLSEALLRVPLVVREPPGLATPAADVVHRPVQLVDVAGTLLGWAAAQPAGTAQRALATSDAEPATAAAILARYDALPEGTSGYFGSMLRALARNCGSRPGVADDIDALVDPPFKLLRYGRHPSELFDVDRDPRESTDLAGSDVERVRSMQSQLGSLVAATASGAARDPSRPTLSPEERERLRALGYVADPG